MKDPSRLDLLVAILGTIGALLLLLAAFAAAAQNTDRAIDPDVGARDARTVDLPPRA